MQYVVRSMPLTDDDLISNLLRDTILALARRYDFEEGHSLQDERLALRLFDETARLGLLALR